MKTKTELNSILYQTTWISITDLNSSADLGPYRLDFTPSGRYMTVGGHKGHLAIVDMKQMSLIKEFQVFLGTEKCHLFALMLVFTVLLQHCSQFYTLYAKFNYTNDDV